MGVVLWISSHTFFVLSAFIGELGSKKTFYNEKSCVFSFSNVYRVA